MPKNEDTAIKAAGHRSGGGEQATLAARSRHEPARVRTALAHVDAEDPTADGASAKSGDRSAAIS
jgi:hypothetical protein